MNKQLFERILDLAGQPSLAESVVSSGEEYYDALVNYYGDVSLINQIKSGDKMASRMVSGNSIQTEKSDNDNLIVRWGEDESKLLILGIISKNGKILRGDVVDLREWMKKVKNDIINGKMITTSMNKFSKPILNKIIKSLESDEINVNIQKSPSPVSLGDTTWENVMIQRA